jgi:rfaE bifunctional protein nucleotidyltransferase chain/domain
MYTLGMIVTLDDLADIRARHQGKKIVLTSGTFDMLHVGHLRYLKAVKGDGDILVVMLSGDARVRGRKGSSRPIIAEHDRALMLDALKLVDYVFIDPADFKEGQLDPVHTEILSQLKPDVYATDGEDIRFTTIKQDTTKMVIIRRDEASTSEEDVNTSTTATIAHIVKSAQAKG